VREVVFVAVAQRQPLAEHFVKVNDVRRIGGCVGFVSELDMEPV